MNALIGERGLERRVHLPPLVVDRESSRESISCRDWGEERRREKTGGGHTTLSDSSVESESELEMDRRPRRGRRRKRSRQHQKPSHQPSRVVQQHAKTAREEEVKVQVDAALDSAKTY